MITPSPYAENHREPVAKNLSDKSFAYKATDAPATALDDQASMHYNIGTLCSTAGGSRVLWSQVPTVMKFLKHFFFSFDTFCNCLCWTSGKIMARQASSFVNSHQFTRVHSTAELQQ